MFQDIAPSWPWWKYEDQGKNKIFDFSWLTANTKVSTTQTLEPDVATLRELAIRKEKNNIWAIAILEQIWDLTLTDMV